MLSFITIVPNQLTGIMIFFCLSAKSKLHVILGAHKGYHKKKKDKSKLLELLPDSQDELPVRNMNVSSNKMQAYIDRQSLEITP